MRGVLRETLQRMWRCAGFVVVLVMGCLAAALAQPAWATPRAATGKVVFPTPAATPEPLVANQPLPLVPMLPGLVVASWRVDLDGFQPATPPSALPVFGPGRVLVDYAWGGRPRLTAQALLQAYRGALAAAGWHIDENQRAPAHLHAEYADQGRMLLLSLHTEGRVLHVVQWEPAAAIPSAALREALTKTGTATLYGLMFATNKGHVRLPAALPVLQQILKLLQDDPALSIEIRVHTDDSFQYFYARRPSDERARNIHYWLINQGIPAVRLRYHGYGQTKPLGSNQTAEGRARNRRVELVRVP